MLGYILLFGFIFLIDKSRSKLSVKYDLTFMVLTLFLGIRFGIGFDYFSYFEMIQENDAGGREFIPAQFITLAHNTHYSLFYLLSSAFTMFFFIQGLRRQNCKFVSIYFFLCFPFFFLASFSIVRQTMAYSVIFYLICCNSLSFLKKLLLIMFAFLCHNSAIFALLLLFPLHKLTKKWLWILCLASMILGNSLMVILSNLSLDNSLYFLLQNYIITEMDGGSLSKILLYSMVFIVLLNFDYLVMRGENVRRYVVYTCLGGIIYSFFSVNAHMAERLCTFFFTSVILLIPYLLKRFNISKLIYVISCLLLFSLYLYTAHNSSYKENRNLKYGVTSSYYPYMTIFEASY